MADYASSPWWVLVAGALPSIASGVWVIWRWQAERSDRKVDGALTREERMARELEAQRIALSKEQAELFTRLRTELARLQVRNMELERNADRGWFLARYWNSRAHELRHAGLNAQTIVTGLCAGDSLPMPAWPDMSVLGFEEPK